MQQLTGKGGRVSSSKRRRKQRLARLDEVPPPLSAEDLARAMFAHADQEEPRQPEPRQPT